MEGLVSVANFASRADVLRNRPRMAYVTGFFRIRRFQPAHRTALAAAEIQLGRVVVSDLLVRSRSQKDFRLRRSRSFRA